MMANFFSKDQKRVMVLFLLFFIVFIEVFLSQNVLPRILQAGDLLLVLRLWQSELPAVAPAF